MAAAPASSSPVGVVELTAASASEPVDAGPAGSLDPGVDADAGVVPSAADEVPAVDPGAVAVDDCTEDESGPVSAAVGGDVVSRGSVVALSVDGSGGIDGVV